MLHPKYLQTDSYTYDLPKEKIAQFPLAGRHGSKLLVYSHHRIVEDRYENIGAYLPAGSLLVFNDTRVIHARLIFQKPGGAEIEIFVLEPADIQGYNSMTAPDQGVARWKCLIGGAGKWKHGQIMEKRVFVNDEPLTLQARIAERLPGSFLIAFSWEPRQLSFAELLEHAGSVPLPPYLKRAADEQDRLQYQTIYADKQGSVAAPTAGLHFTEHIFQSLAAKHIDTAYLTLHVGAGTFLPIKSATLEDHTMHAELIEVDTALLEKLAARDKQIVAVGTTSLRTIESLYWMGVKCLQNPAIDAEELAIRQWDPYEIQQAPAPGSQTALRALQVWMQAKALQKLTIKTQLLIAPPYKPAVANGLITNFHQPGSTLLLLVAAVTGDKWKNIYDYALQHDFRFLSYGDGCLIMFD